MDKKVMVCVTQQKSCEKLIQRGYEIIKGKNDELFVVHVVKNDWRYFSQMEESDALEYLFDVSKKFNADLSIYRSKRIEETLAKFVTDNDISDIIMGESLEKVKQQNMIERLKVKIEFPIKLDIVKRDS
jgi:K+-sensing histidine kinase KdpD